MSVSMPGAAQEHQMMETGMAGDRDLPKARPAQLGYHMPAEWEPHTCGWMGWPQRPDNWRNAAGPAQKAFAAVAAAISQFEPLHVCANPDHEETARSLLPPGVQLHAIPQDDAWFRDSGPTFVVDRQNKKLGGVNWIFNAWGRKVYADWHKDLGVGAAIIKLAGAERFNAPIVLEGGSIHVDGEGTLLTTEECLLNENRNPSLNKQQIEQYLKDYLGVQKIVWLPKGLYKDDDTNGHVDNFACFARPGVVLLAWSDDPNDPQHAISAEALRVLEGSTDAKGRRLQVIKLPCPSPPLFLSKEEADGVEKVKGSMPREDGARLAASYVNFYIPNGGVVMPAFGVPSDQVAHKVLQEAFPDRKVVSVPTRDILLGGGNIHCITQQQPAP